MNNIILEGIKDATETINSNHKFLIDHSTDQLFFLDDILKNMTCEAAVLVNETYSNILMLEFETVLILKAIKYNRRAIILNDSTLEIIKTNCDDLLEKIKQIRTAQESRVKDLSHYDFKRVVNNESDIDLGSV